MCRWRPAAGSSLSLETGKGLFRVWGVAYLPLRLPRGCMQGGGGGPELLGRQILKTLRSDSGCGALVGGHLISVAQPNSIFSLGS